MYSAKFLARKNERGFTLLELVLVFSLVAALSVTASIATYSAMENFRYQSAVSKVITDIRYAQHMARSHNGWYGIEFTIDPVNQYHVYSTDGTSDTDETDPANPAISFIENLDFDFKVRITAVDIGGGSKVEFNPLGTPYLDKSGSALAADGTITLSYSGTSKVIRIIKNTGKVELQ